MQKARTCLRACSPGWLWGQGRWRLYIEGSCPVCQRALSATLFSDKALVKGLTPTGHGCWGGESSSSTPDLLACRRRLSQPPSPLLGLANTLHRNHRHPRGRPYLTLSQHVRSCLSTHTHTARKQPFVESVGKRQNRQHREKVCRAEPSRDGLETGYQKVRKPLIASTMKRSRHRTWIYFCTLN